MAIADESALVDAGAVIAFSDRAAWDALVADLGGQPFQSWAWGELKSAFGWEPHRLASRDGRSALQILIRPYRGLAVAYVPRGPVMASGSTIDAPVVAEALRLARASRAAFVRLEPDVLESDPLADALAVDLRAKGFRTSDRTLQPRSSIRLDITRSEDELLAGFSKGHRADVRRAERDGVTVRVGDQAADVDTLHRMLVATNERKSFGFHSAGYYRKLLAAFGDAARLQVAEREGRPVAASLVLAWGRNGTYLVAGSNAEGLEHRAAHLLQWHAIRWARERGAREWDMWGIADARGRHELAAQSGTAAESDLAALDAAARRDPLDGVYRFKKGWGGRVVRTLPAFDRVFIPPAYWYWQWRRGEA